MRVRRVLIASTLLAAAVALFALAQDAINTSPAFQPPADSLVVGYREAATHRPDIDPIPAPGIIRGRDSPILYLHVNPTGNVDDVRPSDATLAQLLLVRSAALHLHYQPFSRNGQPAAAWVQESFVFSPLPKLPTHHIPFPSITDISKVHIVLKRSGCFGTCPSYSVTIDGDGKVTYSGVSNVSIPGTHTAHIDTKTLQSLIQQFRSANFFSLDDSYVAGITDNPSYCLSFSTGGHSKAITDYVGGMIGMPASITALEDAVDKATDSARWITSSPQTTAAMREAHIAFNSPQATRILRRAVESSDVATVQSLLKEGVSPNLPAEEKKTTYAGMEDSDSPLLVLAVEATYPSTTLALVNTLLETPASQTTPSAIQQALGIAASKGRLDLAQRLIAAGADPTQRFDGGYVDHNLTYLMLAVSSGLWPIIDDALARPHDINATDAKGRTALLEVFWTSPQNENPFPIVDRLLAAGASRSQLDLALASTCSTSWVDGLLARGAHINARDADGNTALFQTCTVEDVQGLLDRGVDPTLRNHAGKTAIEATYSSSNGAEDPRAAVIRRFLARHPHP